jgi:polyphenol oxidase
MTKPLQWIEYDLLKQFPHIRAKTYLRHGGASQNQFASFNLSKSVGDDNYHVQENIEIIKEDLHADDVVFAKQVHGSQIIEVNHDNSNILEGDLLFTKEKNKALIITHADCQAAIFYDDINKMGMVVHAGWKGLVKNVYQKAIDYLQAKGSEKENIIVCISPSLGSDHSEFKNYEKELPSSFFSYKKEGYLFDLKKIAKDQLLSGGILEKNIEISTICTYDNEQDFYSYRRDKSTGRHGTVLMMV